MSVIHVRMDNRLIHGQIIVSWNSAFHIDHIIVTNDNVAKDKILVDVLKAISPLGVKVSVLSNLDCVNYCKNSEAEEKIFIIAKYPQDVKALVDYGLELKEVNLGNQAFTQGSKKLLKTNAVYLTEESVKALKAIHDRGICITFRMMPSNPVTDYWPEIEKSFQDWL